MSIGRRAFFRTFTRAAVAICLCRLCSYAASGEEDWLTAWIERKPVDSTNLSAVGYNRSARVLEVEFRSGAVYRYREVPIEIYRSLADAESKGRYFIRSIRGRYEFRRMNPEHP
jgi:hypothetical protein